MDEQELERLEKLYGAVDESYSEATLLKAFEFAADARARVEGLLTPRLPDYDRNFIQSRFSDTKSDAQAQLVHQTLLKIQHESWRNPDMPLEKVIANVTRGMSKDDIVALPDSFRIELLLAMSANLTEEFQGGDHKYLNEQRFRIALGYDHADMGIIAPVQADARRTLSFSPELANWQVARELEFLKKEAFLFKDNPELADIRARWQDLPAKVTTDEKMKLIEAQHKLHAQVYGYPEGGIVRTDLPGIGAVARDIKFGSTQGIISINPGEFDTLSYAQSRNLILHESDHLAQFSWVHTLDQLPPGDPRRDFVTRLLAFQMFDPVGSLMSKYGGMSVEAMVIYFAKPHETHAHLLHDPGKKPATPDAAPPVPQPVTEKPSCLPALCP